MDHSKSWNSTAPASLVLLSLIFTILFSEAPGFAQTPVPGSGAEAGNRIEQGDSSNVITDQGTGSETITIDATAVGSWTAGGLELGEENVAFELRLPFEQVDSNTTPTLCWGSPCDTGMWERLNNFLYFAAGGVTKGSLSTWGICGNQGISIAGCLAGQNPSATVPSLVPFYVDNNTGIGRSAEDNMMLIAGGVTQMTVETDGVTTGGCKDFGSLSSAPTGGECDRYWDTDLNLICYHNGTAWVQADDWTTACA